MNKILKTFLPHIVAIMVFLAASYVYFLPALEGKVLHGTDNVTAKSQQGEIGPYTGLTGDYCAWTNAAFGGMPAYTVWVKKEAPLNIITKIINFFTTGGPVSYLFIAMISFYILLLCYGVNPWLGIIGGIAYGFSSYFIEVIGAGHVTKAIGLAYMPGVFAGIYIAYKHHKVLWGALIMALFLAMEIGPGHYQIIYYTILVAFTIGLYYLIRAIKQKTIFSFVKSTVVLLIAALIAGLTNISSIWTTQEYAPYSARGKSILSADTTKVASVSNNGLDFEYATQWSYGIAESVNLLIPNFRGGSSTGQLTEKSETYKLISKINRAQAKQVIKNLPLYWGPQPFTEGPAYMGALIVFLFVFAIFFLKNKEKWWIIGISAIALMLAWGNNFTSFNRLVFDYFPLYNKFRAVTTTLFIIQFTMPFLAVLALNRLFKGYDKSDFIYALKWSLGIVGGISLLFALFPGLAGNFQGAGDIQLAADPKIINAIMADRKSILRADSIRSFIFVLAGAGVLWLYYRYKIGKALFVFVIALLVLIDLAMVDYRYVSHDDFATVRVAKSSFEPTKADMSIYDREISNPETKSKIETFLNTYKGKPTLENSESPELLALNLTTDYRVLNLSGGINFSDAITSYYHKSLSGYSPAKLRRYQDIIDRGVLVEQIQNFARDLQTGQNPGSYSLLNMLNTKYIILRPDRPAIYNKEALGNAWFVKKIKWVSTADEEFDLMTKVVPREEAVVNTEFKGQETGNIGFDPEASIQLVNYKPHILTYQSNTKARMLAVFSEVYYPKGWDVYIDGQQVDYLRADYLFRALFVPEGEHTIEFRFEPRSYILGNKLNVVASLILVLLLVILLVSELKKRLSQK